MASCSQASAIRMSRRTVSTDKFIASAISSIVRPAKYRSSIAWAYSLPVLTFAVLFATALADVVLYLVVPDALMRYRCGAQYRMAAGMARHGAFNLETHERYRQQVARMAGHR